MNELKKKKIMLMGVSIINKLFIKKILIPLLRKKKNLKYQNINYFFSFFIKIIHKKMQHLLIIPIRWQKHGLVSSGESGL